MEEGFSISHLQWFCWLGWTLRVLETFQPSSLIFSVSSTMRTKSSCRLLDLLERSALLSLDSVLLRCRRTHKYQVRQLRGRSLEPSLPEVCVCVCVMRAAPESTNQNPGHASTSCLYRKQKWESHAPLLTHTYDTHVLLQHQVLHPLHHKLGTSVHHPGKETGGGREREEEEGGGQG